MSWSGVPQTLLKSTEATCTILHRECNYLPVNIWLDKQYTIGRVLIAWFNDCILGKSGQIANLIIAMVDPVPYYSIRAHVYVCEFITCELRKYSQLKLDLRY